MSTVLLSYLIPLATHLGRYQYNFCDELDLHDALELAMSEGGWHSKREFVLGPKDRIDFMAWRELDGPRIGIEVKVKAAPAAVERQLRRYAEHESVAGLLLVSCSIQLSRLPWEIGGKPLQVMIAGSTI